MPQTIHIEGLKELDQALLELGEEFSMRNPKNVLRGALKDGGQLIANAGASFAPRLTGGLAASYTVGTKLSRRQRKELVKESPLEVYVGPGPAAKAVQTEFGNSHQSPEPHLRPAWDSTWRAALDLIIKRVAERLEQTRQRLVKKAARLAAPQQ